jgi:uracil-DNA glycosylase
MLLGNVWRLLEEQVFSFPSRPGLFNQYGDSVGGLDIVDGHLIRRQNLRNYLASFKEPPSALIVGDAPAVWGSRFSGVPFTSERQLCDGRLPFSGAQSSSGKRPHAERTATVFWEGLLDHGEDFFVWNCVPFFPYQQNNLLSRRAPTVHEIKTCVGFFSDLIDAVGPERIFTVGKKAEYALKQIGRESSHLRNSSFAETSSAGLGLS